MKNLKKIYFFDQDFTNPSTGGETRLFQFYSYCRDQKGIKVLPFQRKKDFYCSNTFLLNIELFFRFLFLRPALIIQDYGSGKRLTLFNRLAKIFTNIKTIGLLNHFEFHTIPDPQKRDSEKKKI